MITSVMGNALISKQVLSTNSSRKCMKISLENLYLDIVALRVKVMHRHPIQER